MISVEIRGAAEVEAALERGAATFAAQVAEETVRRLTLEGRASLFQKMNAATEDRGFWGRGSPPGPVLGRRTSSTIRRLSPGTVFRVPGDPPTFVGSVGHPDKHVAALEHGATIQAQGKFLRIPTKFAQTPSGVDRNAGRSMRGVPGVAVFPSKAGNLFIWASASKTLQALATAGLKVAGTTRGVARAALRQSKEWIPLYMLVQSVKLPEKRLFGLTALQMQPRVDALANIHAEVWVNALGGAAA